MNNLQSVGAAQSIQNCTYMWKKRRLENSHCRGSVVNSDVEMVTWNTLCYGTDSKNYDISQGILDSHLINRKQDIHIKISPIKTEQYPSEQM